MREKTNNEPEVITKIMQIKKIRFMTYDELSTILQIIGGIVLTLSFAIGIAIIWAGIMASKEKDAKVRTQDEALARLNLEVETAKERAAQAEIKAGEIEQQNLKLRIDLKSEKRKRGKLEDHLEPRKLWHSRIIIEKLQKHEGTQYILEFLPHPDAQGSAELIDNILQEADWKRIGIFPNPYNAPNGVEVATRGLKNSPENFFGTRAAKEFASYLKANKWHVRNVRVNIPGYWAIAEQNLGAEKIPDDTVKIFVGLKPDWYFGQKFADELQEARKKEAEREGKPVLEPARLDNHNQWISELETEELEKLRKEWGIF